ncbi:hypothetical protein M9Y10_013304 [Tritrichomonas musculus]|uniref:Uncharacterized protein n=1 Tax=Tritrichomonas musculus TaxID=1915356 RepID=A0ABR2I6N6_9EUKA
MLLLNFLFSLISSQKIICITINETYENANCDASNTINKVGELEDISDKISQLLMSSDTDVYLYGIGKANVKFQMKIFNYKKLNISLYAVTINVSGVHNINASFNHCIVRLIGSSLKDDQTSFHIKSTTISTSIKEIRIKNLTMFKSFVFAEKFYVNSLYYIYHQNVQVNLTDDYLFIVPRYSSFWTQIYFVGENTTFGINMSDHFHYQQYNLTVYNKGTSIDYFDFGSINYIIFNGDGFKESNLMQFTRSPNIVCNVDCLTYAPVYIYSGYTNYLFISKPLVIKGDIIINTNSLHIDTIVPNPKSRLSVEIESMDNGFRIVVDSSWIDVTIKNIKEVKNYRNYEIIPSVGLGGSSSITVLNGPMNDFENLDVFLDFDNMYPNDEYLSLLLSKNWTALAWKMMDDELQNKEIRLFFYPQYTHGFKSFYLDDYETNTILKGESMITNDGCIIKLIPFSYSTIPSYLCYTDSNDTSNGQPFNDLSLLNDLIPDDQNVVFLVLDKKATDLDITTIKSKNLTITLKSTSSGSLKSLKMIDDNIYNLSFDTLIFESEVFKLNVKNISFINITVPPSNFIFNDQAVITTDMRSVLNMTAAKYDFTFPKTKVILEDRSDLFEYRPVFAFEIYDNDIAVRTSKYSYSIPIEKIPDIEFQFIHRNKFFYVYNNATSIKSISFVPLNEDENTILDVHLKNFGAIENAISVKIDLSSYVNKSSIHIDGSVRNDWLTIISDRYEVVDQSIYKANNFCVCNDEQSCNEFCDDEYMTIIKYSELTEKVKTTIEGSVQIIIVGNDNEIDVPLLVLDYVDNKDVFIFGYGTNPKIRIDSSSKFTDLDRRVAISGVRILSDSSKGSIFISNLNVDGDCTIDESCNEVSLISNNLNMSVLQLSFKTIHVNKFLFLYGDARKTEAKTKVTFSPHAKFSYTLPYTITFKDCLLVIKEIEFNLTQVVPLFSIEDKRFYPFDKETLFTINAIDANLDVIDDNITLHFCPDDFRIIGNFVNENPSKFIILNPADSNYFLQAENIPAIMTIRGSSYIILEKEKVSIAGKITFTFNIREGNCRIYSSIDDATIFHVSDVFVDFYYNSLIFFNSTKTQMIIDKFDSANEFRKIVFNLLVDLSYHNQVQISNKIEHNDAIRYKVQLLIPGTLYEQHILDFINKSHTLLVLNELNTVTSSCIDEIKFLSNIEGFVNDNFKLVVDKNNLLLTTVQSPQISLRYGNCSSCLEIEITNDDLDNIDKFILYQNAVLSVTFYESNSIDNCLNFDKNDIKIQSLTLKSFEFLDSAVKLGKSVSYLKLENVSVVIQDSNGFSIQKVKLTKGAKFNDLVYYDRVNLLEIDQESLFLSGLVEFKNQISVSADSLLEVNFTSKGVKLVNMDSKVFDLDTSKFPHLNLVIESNNSPVINLEEGVSKIIKLNSLVFNSSNISIGSGWDQTSSEIEFTIKEEENKNISVFSDSFPFDSWHSMYDYPINLSSKLSPFTFADLTLNVHNKSMKINVPNNEKIVVGSIVTSDNSSMCVSFNSTLTIDNLTILNGTSLINNSFINNEITLGKGSVLKGNFSINEDLNVLNYEWDLDQAPIIDCLSFQETVPKRINVIYKGSEIKGRERQFDKFLSRGATLMTNVSSNDMLANIHFISDTVSEFKDGNELVLKVILAYDKKYMLISTKLFIEEEEEEEIEYPSSLEEVVQTETPTKGDEPSIGDSFESTGTVIEFTENGFIDGEKFVQVDDNGDDKIKFINTNQKALTLKAGNKESPNKELFVSPQISDTVITISPPSDESDDYGKSQFGVHANSKNPTINLHNEKVPLNIFNNEKSDINFNIIKSQRSFNSKISLKNLIVSNGDLKMVTPNEVDGIEFNKVETFLNGNIRSLNIDQKSTEISIDSIKLNSGSSIKMSNIFFNKTIEMKPNTKIEIERKVTFDDQTTIEIDETSFIEFGKSEINGICNKIRITQIQSKRMIENADSSEIICGEKFECQNWKEKFETNSHYKFSRCAQNQNKEMCLVVSSKDDQPKKKKLSAGAIAGISVAVCVVVIAAVVLLVIFLVRKKKSSKTDEENVSAGEDYL